MARLRPGAMSASSAAIASIRERSRCRDQRFAGRRSERVRGSFLGRELAGARGRGKEDADPERAISCRQRARDDVNRVELHGTSRSGALDSPIPRIQPCPPLPAPPNLVSLRLSAVTFGFGNIGVKLPAPGGEGFPCGRFDSAPFAGYRQFSYSQDRANRRTSPVSAGVLSQNGVDLRAEQARATFVSHSQNSRDDSPPRTAIGNV